MARTEKTYQTKKELIAVRVDKDLLDLVILHANAKGMNLSEYVRKAMENEVNKR